MKVIDCFPFFDEFLMLDVRFKELYDLVDKFVIVESKETFSGIEKPLYLSDCLWEKYPQYADKVEIIVPERKSFSNAWDREHYQKNHISKEKLSYLNLNDEDLILFADADEIPKRWVIDSMIKNGFNHKGGGFGGNCYYYKFNILTTEWSYRPKWISYGNLTNFTEQRYDETFLMIPDSGWHFSFIKSPEQIKTKIQAFSHQEFNNESINNISNIKSSIDEVKDLFGRSNVHLKVVPLDDSFPVYIKENLDSLKEWIANYE
jgi:beta-1,4-mannosyl-glycoprotein beta-1,4-N-acetylglucosaminyltransferase